MSIGRLAVAFLITAIPVLASGQDLPDSYPPPIDRGTYYLEFAETDSIEYPDPPSLPDSTSPADYTFLKPPSDNKKTGGVWKIALTDGNPDLIGDDTVYVDPKAHSSTQFVSFSLAEYYPEHELILFESLRNEYTRYVIVARGNGEVAVVFGPPVFSPNGEWFITMGKDTPSGWSPVGLQLFAVGKGYFRRIIHFRTGKTKYKYGRKARSKGMGGPARCQWIDEDTFQLEMVDSRLVRSDSYSHYRVHIRKGED